MKKEILILVSRSTPRLAYTCDFIFTEMLGLTYRFTDKESEARQHEGPLLVYRDTQLDDLPWIQAHGLLSEEGIHERSPAVSAFRETTVLFGYPSPTAALLPFDPLAATFYMLSRYEEYLPGERDVYDRFTAAQSLAVRHGFLKQPVVHRWVELLAEKLKEHYPELNFTFPTYQFIPTLDIDNAYAYLKKGVWRATGAACRDLLKLNWREFGDRLKVLTGSKKDPYDSFAEFSALHKEFGIKPLIFWLLGDYGPHDKNISPSNASFRALIHSLSAESEAGIHPSFHAAKHPDALKMEKQRLEEITGQAVAICRMHYLRLRLPDTYEELLRIGIKKDFSMGFSDESGFRAGVAVPFYFYHLGKEEKTDLQVHPFCVMDATLKYRKNYTAEEAFNEIAQMIAIVREAGGCFYPVFHNESLGTKKMWKGWRDVYRRMLEAAKS